MTESNGRELSRVTAGEPLVVLVLGVLAQQLERALGTDPWAVGHRTAALAFAARLTDEDDLNGLVLDERVDAEVVPVLRRYLADPRDTRGFATS